MKINKQVFQYAFIAVFIQSVFVFLSLFIKTFAYLSVAVFVIDLLFLVKYKKKFIFKYCVIILNLCLLLLGCILIEFFPRVFLVELQSFSYFNGAIAFLSLFLTLMVSSLLIFDERYEKPGYNHQMLEIKLEKNKAFINLCAAIVLLLFLLLFSQVVLHPAFSMGVDRFVYAQLYKVDGVIGKIETEAPLLLVFSLLAILYGNKIIGISGVITYILYFLWTGNKFGPFLTLINVFVLVFYNRFTTLNKAKIKRLFRILIIVFACIISFALYFAISTENYSAIAYLQQRGAQQGQLWWKSYEVIKNFHPEEFLNDFFSQITTDFSLEKGTGLNFGIYKIMYLCAPSWMVTDKLATGSRYTQAGYACAYYYFGIVGAIVFSIFYAYLFCHILNKFIFNLRNRDYIAALIFLRFYFISETAFSMFLFDDYFDILSILSYMYIVYSQLRKSKIDRHNTLHARYPTCH